MSLTPIEAFESSSAPQPKIQNAGNTLLETQEFENFPEGMPPGSLISVLSRLWHHKFCGYATGKHPETVTAWTSLLDDECFIPRFKQLTMNAVRLNATKYSKVMVLQR